MKKATRFLAALAAMTTLAVSAVPVCAETTDGNTREENLDIASDSDSFDTAEVEQNSYIIDEYIAKNDIDARCKYLGNADEPQDRIEIKYVNDKSRQQVESFIKEQGYDTTYITFSEMSEDDKFTFIAQRKLIRFRSKTGNSCDYRYNGFDSKTVNTYYPVQQLLVFHIKLFKVIGYNAAYFLPCPFELFIIIEILS